MKVLHVYKFFSPVRGGGIAAMESVIKGLNGTVESSVLVAARSGWGGREFRHGANVHRVFSFGYLNSMPIAPTLPLWFAVESRRADIVHIHLPFPIADLALSLRWPKAPVVLHWHSDIVQQARGKRLLWPILRESLERADRILVGSPRHVDSSEDLRPFRDKCVVMPYGIDIDKWANLAPETKPHVRKLRARYSRMVFFLGRLVAYKGLPVLLRAMRDIDAMLVVAGEGPMAPHLRRLVEQLEIGHKVHFAGALPFEELKAHYHACSIFVLSSIWRNEAFGLAQLEAMACGRPVVNTNLPTGVPWVARHGREALTVPPGDVAAMSNAIQRLLDDPEEASRLGRAGYERVKEVFDCVGMSRGIYSLYKDMLYQRTAGS